ncbi:hypothetical protein WJX77_012542 [Trebouxia sp. C0004]
MEGLAFDEHAWAVEHFLLNDPKAPTVLGQRQTAAAVLTGPIANGVRTVYPGKAGEELWVTWRGRYATLGRYPSWQLLLRSGKRAFHT